MAQCVKSAREKSSSSRFFDDGIVRNRRDELMSHPGTTELTLADAQG